jgi:four helix bundle protein
MTHAHTHSRFRLVSYHKLLENGGVLTDFNELEVWRMSHQLMLSVYKIIRSLPREERYNRADQLLRSVSSIPANIAEGCGRWYYLENIAFCRKARGSLYETKNHLVAVRDLKQIDTKTCNDLISDCDRIRQVLNGYIRYLRNKKVGEK